MVEDPRVRLAQSPMTMRQIMAVALCVVLNALDGFDVLAISFASPGIASEWGIDRAALGLVLSMELIGMAVGSIILGNAADRLGRRPMILACLVIMSIGMWLATLAGDVQSLSAYRLFTGFGIGGMLACTNAMVAEYSNDRARNLAVAIMAAGYPMGVVIGGTVASGLLESGGWRDVFHFGAVVTAAFFPIAWFLLPESVGYLMQARPKNALQKINRALRGVGHKAIHAIPERESAPITASPLQLFSPTLRRATLLLTASYFAHIMTFYFILKWIPKIVVDMGYAPAAAGGVLVWANAGGLLGALLLSMLSWRIGIRALAIVAMLGSCIAVAWFGQGQSNLDQLGFVAATAGFCANAGVVGLYAIIAATFPTEVRASGTGLIIGIGRGGAALGPIAAGLLFSFDIGLPIVAGIMAAGSLCAAIALLFLSGRAKFHSRAEETA
ncbi:MFS transporter [Sphingosinicella microcystinivorans]|nr:MFS transporter [Sphingosinicella microcystinivorans]WBX86437.1 MFS transporter [Sphingosinicella microcystinivorans]